MKQNKILKCSKIKLKSSKKGKHQLPSDLHCTNLETLSWFIILLIKWFCWYFVFFFELMCPCWLIGIVWLNKKIYIDNVLFFTQYVFQVLNFSYFYWNWSRLWFVINHLLFAVFLIISCNISSNISYFSGVVALMSYGQTMFFVLVVFSTFFCTVFD